MSRTRKHIIQAKLKTLWAERNDYCHELAEKLDISRYRIRGGQFKIPQDEEIAKLEQESGQGEYSHGCNCWHCRGSKEKRRVARAKHHKDEMLLIKIYDDPDDAIENSTRRMTLRPGYKPKSTRKPSIPWSYRSWEAPRANYPQHMSARDHKRFPHIYTPDGQRIIASYRWKVPESHEIKEDLARELYPELFMCMHEWEGDDKTQECTKCGLLRH